MQKQSLSTYRGLQKCFKFHMGGVKNAKTGPVHLSGAPKMLQYPWGWRQKWKNRARPLIGGTKNASIWWMVESTAVLKTMWKSEFQNTTKSVRALVESSAVWKTVWTSEFQNTTKSPREFVESSAVWKTVWKSESQNTTKSPRELVESSAVWKTVWKSEFQNTTKSHRELSESSAVNGT